MNRFIRTELGVWLNIDSVDKIYVICLPSTDGGIYFQACAETQSGKQYELDDVYKTREEAQKNLDLFIAKMV